MQLRAKLSYAGCNDQKVGENPTARSVRLLTKEAIELAGGQTRNGLSLTSLWLSYSIDEDIARTR
jgi:hypothetical protein